MNGGWRERGSGDRECEADSAASGAGDDGGMHAMETELERAANEYARALRRAWNARDVSEMQRRDIILAVRDADRVLVRAALEYRTAPGRISPETTLQHAATECVRAADRAESNTLQQTTGFTFVAALEMLHNAAIEEYDPEPNAPRGEVPRLPAKGDMTKLNETLAWMAEMAEYVQDHEPTQEEEDAFYEELQSRFQETMEEIHRSGGMMRYVLEEEEERE